MRPDPGEPQHRARVGRHAAADDPPAQGVDRQEERVLRVGLGGPGGQDEVGRVGPAYEARPGRRLDGIVVVLDVVDADDLRAEALHLGPDARLEPLARGARARDSLTTTPTRRAANGATQTSGCEPKPAMRAPASTTAASTTCGATLTLATRSPFSTIWPSKTREDLERVQPVEPLELRDPDVDDTGGRGDEVQTALIRAADIQAGAGDGLGQADGGLVLVEFAGLGDEDRDRSSRDRAAAASASEVVRRQPPALRPAPTADRQVAGQDGAREAPRARVDQE